MDTDYIESNQIAEVHEHEVKKFNLPTFMCGWIIRESAEGPDTRHVALCTFTLCFCALRLPGCRRTSDTQTNTTNSLPFRRVASNAFALVRARGGRRQICPA